MLPEIVRPIDQLSAMVVQRNPEPNAVALFKVEHGVVSQPVTFVVEANAGLAASPLANPEPVIASVKPATEKKTPHSMESRLAEAVQAMVPRKPNSALELNENLALLKRWYYRSRRSGEIFFADDHGGLP